MSAGNSPPLKVLKVRRSCRSHSNTHPHRVGVLSKVTRFGSSLWPLSYISIYCCCTSGLLPPWGPFCRKERRRKGASR